MKIGIGITAHNRQEELNICLKNMDEWLPDNSIIVVVDDASITPLNTSGIFHYNIIHRFDKNVGIARAKNKCLELLQKQGCTDFFLFDEDTYPISDKWWIPYIKSSEPHLMYIFTDFSTSAKLNDTIVIYQDNEKIAYSHARGCMIYLNEICLYNIGGMHPVFGKWGYEHPDLSNRIYNAGLTSFRYMDVIGSNKLIYSGDEHQSVDSTCIGRERITAIQRNKPIYDSRRFSKEYVSYITGSNTVLTSYFTTIPDPQRGTKWECDINALNPLIDSIKQHSYKVLTDSVTSKANPNFVHMPVSINPYFQRWVSYREYLIKNKDNIGFIWCVDATDVIMLNDPFPHMRSDTLYTGDEPGTLNNIWLKAHHKHPTLQNMMTKWRTHPLLNAGILGGHIDIVIDFCGKMIDYYTQFEEDAKLRRVHGAGLTDMAVFNLVAYGHFKPVHGRQITTVFKAEQLQSLAWWKHK